MARELGWYEKIQIHKLPVSVCKCGHSGDGPNSMHRDTLQPGHGACTERYCQCEKFTWAGFTPRVEKILAEARRKARLTSR